MGMSMPYEAFGRTKQKLRTRDALIEATRALIADGLTPNVEDAAARAAISRTTAYRYFPNQRGLLIAAHPEIDRRSLLGANLSREPSVRLAAVLEEFHRIVLETEPQLRMALRLSLDHGDDQRDTSLRRGRAIAWIEEALSPGFIIEELDDGRYTALVPSVPTPAAGSLFILPRERVHPVDVPFTSVVKVISHWGAGAGEMARGVSSPG